MIKRIVNYQYIIAVIFIVFITIGGIAEIAIPDRTFSESENRNLEQRPEFRLDKLFEGKFTKNFETYITDQFPMRDFWVGLKSNTEISIGKKENNDIYIGKDGYLFQKFSAPQSKDISERAAAINSFVDKNPDLNKYIMLAPTSIEVLKSKLPLYAPSDSESEAVNALLAQVSKNIRFINIFDTMDLQKSKYIYYRTDHHWTSKGAYYAYEKFCSEAGISPNKQDYYDIKKVTDNFYGTSCSKGGFRNIEPDSISLYTPKKPVTYKITYSESQVAGTSLFDMKALSKKDKYSVFFGGNHPLVKIKTGGGGKKILIIKDSYANSFIPFLTGNYGEIFAVDLRYYQDDIQKLIKDNGIQDVLILYNVNTFFTDTSILMF